MFDSRSGLAAAYLGLSPSGRLGGSHSLLAFYCLVFNPLKVKKCLTFSRGSEGSPVLLACFEVSSLLGSAHL